MLDPKEELKFEALRDMCRELRVPPPPEVFIDYKVQDKYDTIIQEDICRGHSWTRNFWNGMYGSAASASCVGTSYAAGSSAGEYYAGVITTESTYRMGSVYCIAGATDSTYGIQLGTATTPFNINNYVLTGLIAHDNTAGTLYYQASNPGVTTYASKTYSTALSRVFNNNSGGTITINETGIMAYAAQIATTNIGWRYLLERTVLVYPIIVPNGGQLTLTYRINMDFSAID